MKEELLKVLDMSELKQNGWCLENTDMKATESLADLAFRLRDEAIEIKEIKDDVILSLPWLRACYLIVNGKLDSCANVSLGEEAEHTILKRKPIYWIIAALIAKENM
jgi:hypothetical protein